MAAAECSDEGTSLKDVFEQGFLLHCQIEDNDEPSTSEAYQVIFTLVTVNNGTRSRLSVTEIIQS